MYKISPLTPLFFNPSTDAGLKSRYIQEFCKTDHILLQIIGEGESEPPSVFLINYIDNSSYKLELLKYKINDEQTLFFKELYSLYEGLYTVVIENIESEPFRISDTVQNSVLLQYSNSDNRQRTDTVFNVDGMQYFFDFRVPGGFKDDDWSFGVDNEQYTTSTNDVIDIYSSENTQKQLTIGNACGCPIWFAEKLNRALCCNYFYVDGIRYSRTDSNTPEMNVLIEGVRSYVFKQSLRRVITIDSKLESRNQMLLRRVNDSLIRNIDGSDIYKFKIIEV